MEAHKPVCLIVDDAAVDREMMQRTLARQHPVPHVLTASTLAEARQQLGPDVTVAGNLDPMVLFAPEDVIRREVGRVLEAGGGQGHILNVGNGIIQGTPPEAVGLVFELARDSGKVPALA